MRPLVSIILPAYNGARYLAEAIESCVRQTYRNWELILVDDCSVEYARDVDYRFRDARDTRSEHRHEHNRKLPEALNTGHAAARGEYLTWTSDDNRLLPTTLEELTAYLRPASSNRSGLRRLRAHR